MPDRELYEAVIGPAKPGYYLAYFGRADARGYAPMSWNWPAFFLGMFWFLYRKQYQWALIIFLFPYLAMLVSYAPTMIGIGGLENPMFLLLVLAFQAGYVPLHANGIYYKWAKTKIKDVRAGLPGQTARQTELLSAQGGTNRNLPFIVVMTLILLMVLVPLSQAPA